MKKVTAMILCLFLCCTICSCNMSSDQSSTAVSFYYTTDIIHYKTNSNVIEKEIFDAGAQRSDLEYLLTTYLSGPTNDKMISPFPPAVKLSQATVKDNTVNIVLSNEFAMLAGHELTIACACLTLTALNITQAESVLISADSALLNNTEFISMDGSCIYLVDAAAK